MITKLPYDWMIEYKKSFISINILSFHYRYYTDINIILLLWHETLNHPRFYIVILWYVQSFPGFKGCITVKWIHFLNLPDCSCCCVLALSHRPLITRGPDVIEKLSPHLYIMRRTGKVCILLSFTDDNPRRWFQGSALHQHFRNAASLLQQLL